VKRTHNLLIYTAVILLLCIGAVVLYADRIIPVVAKHQLARVFPGSTVSVGGCTASPAHSIELTDIEIRKGTAFNLTVKNARVSYSIASLLSRTILDVYAGDAACHIDLSGNLKTDIKKIFKASDSKSVFRLLNIRLSTVHLALKSRDIRCSGTLSIELSPSENLVRAIDCTIDTLKTEDLLLEQANLKGMLGTEGAGFHITKMRYNGVKLDDISGAAILNDTIVLLKSLTARLFDGIVSGHTRLSIDKEREFAIDLQCAGINLNTFVNDLKLNTKFQMTGILSGRVTLEGKGFNLNRVAGTLSTDPAGGVLVIHDTRFLEEMAKKSGQPLNIVMEIFRQYQYTIGVMKLSVDGANLVLNIALEGEAGKRTFDVILHDFISKKGWFL